MGDSCPVYRPTRDEFEQPFCEYVKKVFRKHPDLAMFKVVPPRGWRPRRTPFPDLRKVQINVPIRQHVFGTKGAYRCLFVEQKPMSVAEYKLAAEEETARLRGSSGANGTGGGDGSAGSGVRVSSRTTSARHNRPPYEYEFSKTPTGAEGAEGAVDGAAAGSVDPDAVDTDLERAFWSNVTLNPPMYGADTPTSFFDEKLPYGWNLQHLGDLLQKHPEIDSVPGVTTPMTYFGMWRSFFGWHKEDADLYSVNFLHWGAPKVWYGVAPSAKYKFERMAQSLFPELHRSCPAFVRHKDIMLSPSCLKTYGVPCMRACQRANEFIVLNAAAYHAGFNSGFNCAEAVNFAMKEWIPVGKEAVPCRCSALRDGVRISMKLFDPKWVDPYETPSGESSSDEDQGDSEAEGSEAEEDSEDGGQQTAKRRRGGGRRQAATQAAKKPRGKNATTAAAKKASASASTKKGRRAKKPVAEESEVESGSSEEENEESGAEEAPRNGKPKRKRKLTKKAAEAAEAAADNAEEEAAAGARSRSRPTAPVAMTSGSSKRATTTAAATVVKKAIAKSRGAGDTVKPKAAAVTRTTASRKAKAAAEARPDVEPAKRGPGRPRRAADASATTTEVASSPTLGRGGRKRKAEEETEKVPTERTPEEEEAAAPADGSGSRPRRAAAAAAGAVTAAMAMGTRKRTRASPVDCTAVKDGTNVATGAADGSEAVAGGTRGAVSRRAMALGDQVGDLGAVEVKDGRLSCGGKTSGRIVAATTTATPPGPPGTAVALTTAASEPPPAAPAPTPALPIDLPAVEVNTEGRVVVTAVKPRSTVEAAAMALKARTNTPCQEAVVGPPMAIIGDSDPPAGRRSTSSLAPAAAAAAADKRFFFLVQRLARPAPTPGNVLLRWMKEGRDGLFRPVAGSVWEEPAGALLPVRALAVGNVIGGVPVAEGLSDEDDEDASGSGADATCSSSPSHSAAGGPATETTCEPEAWRLVTPREQIVDVELRRE